MKESERERGGESHTHVQRGTERRRRRRRRARQSEGARATDHGSSAPHALTYVTVVGLPPCRYLTYGKHQVNICDRWNQNKVGLATTALFNGIGMESWENVWYEPHPRPCPRVTRDACGLSS